MPNLTFLESIEIQIIVGGFNSDGKSIASR